MNTTTNTTTSTTTSPLTLESTIDTHLDAYGEPDGDRRAGLIAAVWAEDGHLFDPPIDGQGHQGIDAMFAAVQGQFGGHTFRRTTAVDSHHGIARYGWSLVAPDGSVTLAGMDVAVVDADGKLSKVVGFFGDPTPL